AKANLTGKFSPSLNTSTPTVTGCGVLGAGAGAGAGAGEGVGCGAAGCDAVPPHWRYNNRKAAARKTATRRGAVRNIRPPFWQLSVHGSCPVRREVVPPERSPSYVCCRSSCPVRKIAPRGQGAASNCKLMSCKPLDVDAGCVSCYI